MNKYYIVLISSVFVCFLLGGSYAWLNPRPGYVPAYRISETVPFLWQYNTDARGFINLARNFPDDYDSGDHVRISRPLYPALAKLFGHTVLSFTSVFVEYDFKEDKNLAEAALGFVLVKLIFFSIYTILCFRLLLLYFDPMIALFATLLSLLGMYPIECIGTYHTLEAQFITPLVVTFFFVSLSRNYSHTRNIGLSLIAGIILLTKPIFSVYLACALAGLITRNFRKCYLGIIFTSIPVMLWIFISISQGWASSQSSGDISFYLPTYIQQVFGGNAITVFKKFQKDIQQYINAFAIVYSFWIIPAILGLRELWNESLEFKTKLYIVSLVFFAWFQASFSDMTHNWRTVTDFGFIVFGFSAYYLLSFTRRKNIPDKWVIVVCVSIWIAWSLSSMLRLPWVHPYDQVTTLH